VIGTPITRDLDLNIVCASKDFGGNNVLFPFVVRNFSCRDGAIAAGFFSF